MLILDSRELLKIIESLIQLIDLNIILNKVVKLLYVDLFLDVVV